LKTLLSEVPSCAPISGSDYSFCSLSRMLEMTFFVTGCPFAVRFKCAFLSVCLFL
jgi:hypothetical protein